MNEELTAARAWERLPDEPLKWFRRFEKYLLAGQPRSVEGAWKAEARQGAHSKQQQVPSGHWHRIAKQWLWRKRAEAWDAAQAELSAKEIETERNEEARARRDLLRTYRGQVEKALRNALPRANWQDITSSLRMLCEQSRLEFGLEQDVKPGGANPREIRGVVVLPPMEDAPQ